MRKHTLKVENPLSCRSRPVTGMDSTSSIWVSQVIFCLSLPAIPVFDPAMTAGPELSGNISRLSGRRTVNPLELR